MNRQRLILFILLIALALAVTWSLFCHAPSQGCSFPEECPRPTLHIRKGGAGEHDACAVSAERYPHTEAGSAQS